MTAITIKSFRGMVPRIGDRLLQPNQATRAMNCKITAGRLDPLAGLGVAYKAAVKIKTTYRYRHYDGADNIDNWLTWPVDVNVVRSPLANDSQGKLYFSSDSFEPRMTTFSAAIAGASYPAAWFALGVASPTTTASVSVSGGAAPAEERSYAYTFVTPLGEESGPSPASGLVTGNQNGTWTVSGMQTAPPNNGTVTAATVIAGGRVRVTLDSVFGMAQFDTITLSGVQGMVGLNGLHRILALDVANKRVDVALQTTQAYTSGGTWTRNALHNTIGMTKRIYRSAGTSGSFLFVDEIPVTQTSYTDTKSGKVLKEVIPTASTLPPPKNLTCLISLPNGCLVGLADNELCFSEPYKPYSWPADNRYSFSGRGVALCPAGNSVIVLTDGFPIIFIGSDPEAMSPNTMETYAPCVSKRGMVDVGGGCLYPSFDGLWLAVPGQVTKLTKNLYREEEWKLLNPASFDAAFHDGQYFGYYRSQIGDVITRRIWVLDIAESDSTVEVDEWADCLCRNEIDGKLYLSQGDTLYEWDAQPGWSYSSDWKSQTYQLGRPGNFAVAQVHAEFADIVPPDTQQITANQALIDLGADAVAGWLNGQEILAAEICGSFIVPTATLATEKKVQFTLFANGAPVFTTNVVSSAPFRLPSGFMAEVFNVALKSSIRAYSVTIAESLAELAQAS
jgi:hypothetical protein